MGDFNVIVGFRRGSRDRGEQEGGGQGAAFTERGLCARRVGQPWRWIFLFSLPYPPPLLPYPPVYLQPFQRDFSFCSCPYVYDPSSKVTEERMW